jgi:hypothetical protein
LPVAAVLAADGLALCVFCFAFFDFDFFRLLLLDFDFFLVLLPLAPVFERRASLAPIAAGDFPPADDAALEPGEDEGAVAAGGEAAGEAAAGAEAGAGTAGAGGWAGAVVWPNAMPAPATIATKPNDLSMTSPFGAVHLTRARERPLTIRQVPQGAR